MAEIIEATGKTVEDALSYALDKLGCGRAEITYEILQKPSSGFLGLWGKREARIRVTTRPVIPPQRTEVPTPPPPTVLTSPPAPVSAPREEERAQDDGFGVRRRFHTDLRSSARKSAEQGAPQRRTQEERQTRAPRGGYGESRRESSGQGGYGERRERPARRQHERAERAPHEGRENRAGQERPAKNRRPNAKRRQNRPRPRRDETSHE